MSLASFSISCTTWSTTSWTFVAATRSWHCRTASLSFPRTPSKRLRRSLTRALHKTTAAIARSICAAWSHPGLDLDAPRLGMGHPTDR